MAVQIRSRGSAASRAYDLCKQFGVNARARTRALRAVQKQQ